MSRTAVTFSIAAIVGVAVIAIAFVAAPRSCEGGLELYFWSGIGSLAVLTALPFVLMSSGNSVFVRLAWAVGFFAFGSAVWLAGLFLANVRIMCRLF